LWCNGDDPSQIVPPKEKRGKGFTWNIALVAKSTGGEKKEKKRVPICYDREKS